jgi:hypothetical protein
VIFYPSESVTTLPTNNRYKFVTVSLPKWFHNGRFTSKTAVPGSRSGLKYLLGLLETSIYNGYQGRDDGRGYLQNNWGSPAGDYTAFSSLRPHAQAMPHPDRVTVKLFLTYRHKTQNDVFLGVLNGSLVVFSRPHFDHFSPSLPVY